MVTDGKSPPNHQHKPHKLKAIKLVASDSHESIPGEHQSSTKKNKQLQISTANLHKRQSSLPEVNFLLKNYTGKNN